MNFIHASFLAAGLAVALPIIIHLLFQQRTRCIDRFNTLFAASGERASSQQTRSAVVIAGDRMLAVLLLATLFARPYWDQAEKQALEREVVLLIDRRQHGGHRQ